MALPVLQPTLRQLLHRIRPQRRARSVGFRGCHAEQQRNRCRHCRCHQEGELFSPPPAMLPLLARRWVGCWSDRNLPGGARPAASCWRSFGRAHLQLRSLCRAAGSALAPLPESSRPREPIAARPPAGSENSQRRRCSQLQPSARRVLASHPTTAGPALLLR